jgi:predicted unusual protein kinase regulating ubiquinone biosynthesis (AarF/ABC1/UbiB family)
VLLKRRSRNITSILFQRVLVMDYIAGCKISDVKYLRDNGFSLKDINLKLFEMFGHQIFESGFVHADPHAGNST